MGGLPLKHIPARLQQLSKRQQTHKHRLNNAYPRVRIRLLQQKTCISPCRIDVSVVNFVER